MKKYLIALLLALPCSLLCQTFTMPVRVNLDKSLRADRSPLMKLDRNGNIFIAWVSGADANGNGPISMAVSTDGGNSFSNNSVCSDANCNANFQRTAQFVLDTKGRIHLIWMGNRVNSQPDIWYTRSVDQGKTWTVPVSVCDAGDSSKFAQDFPSIACDSSDNLYVSFLDSRETQQKKSNTPHLYFTRSTDGGTTWSVNTKVDLFAGGIGGTCECCTEHIAATSDGHLSIVFRSNINNVRDIWLARSNDKGLTFQPALKIMSGDWNISACPVTGPNIAVDDSGGAHIVWRDARDNTGGTIHLYYAFVPSGSQVTPVNEAFDASGSQSPNYPDIAIFGNHRVIAYETYNFGMRYILTSDTTSIVNNRPMTVNGSSNKEFANVRFASDGTRYLCWQDDKNDAGDIYFAKETSQLTSARVSDPRADAGFAIYPNPISLEAHSLTADHPSYTPSSIEISDVLGRVLLRAEITDGAVSTTINLPNLRAGTYYCTLVNGSSRITKTLVVE